MAGHVARMRRMRNAYNVLVGNSERKMLVKGATQVFDNIEVCVQENGWKVVNAVHLAQNRRHLRATVRRY